jgi:hypothetical protein
MAGTEGKIEGGGMEVFLVAMMIESGDLNMVDDERIIGRLCRGRLLAATKRTKRNTTLNNRNALPSFLKEKEEGGGLDAVEIEGGWVRPVLDCEHWRVGYGS